MSSEEMSSQEKGKEVATLVHHKKMVLSKEEIEVLLKSDKESYEEEKGGIEEGESSSSSSSSKITPCIFYTSDEKARLRWSTDLHDCFVNAVQQLGGPNKATPKSVREKMEVEGIAVHHVKSHLQKFRLGKCNIRDGTNQYLRRFKTARDVKRCASLNSSRPQVNIKPRVGGATKSKPKKETEAQGSLYIQIENDVRVRRFREAQRIQNALAIESQRNMLETQYLKVSTTPSLYSQHNNYVSTSRQPLSYNHVVGETNAFTMNYRLQGPSIMIPQNNTCVEDLCNEGMSCLSLSEPSIHPTQANLQFNHIKNKNKNMAHGFINPYMNIESQSMLPALCTITTQHQFQFNDVIHDSYGNTTFYSATIQPTFETLDQGTLNNTSLLPESVPHHGYMSSYPPYNTLEVVRAQLSALQNSSSNQTQERLSSCVTVDEEDPVDKYIDWAKVEERDIFDLDTIEVIVRSP